MIEELKTNIEESVSKIADIKKAMTQEIRDKLIPVYESLFALDDRLKMISWTQYTPYFNDGDTCEFGVNEIYYNGSDDNYDYDTPQDENDPYSNRAFEKEIWIQDKETKKYGKILNPKFDELAHKVVSTKILESIPDDIWYDIYGDHCQVTIIRTNTGIEVNVEEYSHD